MKSKIYGETPLATHPVFLQTFIIIALSFFFSDDLCFAGTDETKATPPAISVPQFTGRPVIDGFLNDSVWNNAARITTFTQREPEENKPASEKTDVALAFDTHNLYIGIRCYDSQIDQLVANEMRYDVDLSENDRIEILFDTFNDGRNAFFFSTNPLGVQRDGLVRNEGENMNWDWNGVWFCSTQIDSLGWTAELAIPFRTLRFDENGPGEWGMNIGRFIMRNREEVFSTPVLRDYGYLGEFKVSKFGHISGFKNISQGSGLQVKPYLAGGMEDDRFTGNNSISNVGLDLKYSITTNLAADLTVNTDFAQVEADQERINLTRFDLYYPEKREFFLEGAGIFWFGERYSGNYDADVLFFSRRIGLSRDGSVKIPLLGGVRTTGKIGETDLGVLSIWTDKKNVLDENGNSMEIPLTNVSVLRVKQPVFGQSSVGVIGVNKQAGSIVYNRTAGADWNFFLTEQLQIGGFAAKTFDYDLTRDNGTANIDVNYMTDDVELQAQYMTIDNGFNPELGYVPRTGVRKLYFCPAVATRPGFFGIRKTFLFGEFSYHSKPDWSLESGYNLLSSYTLFENGSELFVGVPWQKEVLTEDFYIRNETIIPAGTYTFTRFVANYYSDRSRPLSGSITEKIGSFYNGTINTLELGAAWKPSIHWKFDVQYQRNDIKLPVENGTFATNLIIGRINWGLTTKMFSKLFVQWNDADSDMNINLLFNYQYLPNSDIYLVYNEQWDVQHSPRINNRTIVAKMTYLLNV
jgi:hypothetical protein